MQKIFLEGFFPLALTTVCSKCPALCVLFKEYRKFYVATKHHCSYQLSLNVLNYIHNLYVYVCVPIYDLYVKSATIPWLKRCRHVACYMLHPHVAANPTYLEYCNVLIISSLIDFLNQQSFVFLLTSARGGWEENVITLPSAASACTALLFPFMSAWSGCLKGCVFAHQASSWWKGKTW